LTALKKKEKTSQDAISAFRFPFLPEVCRVYQRLIRARNVNFVVFRRDSLEYQPFESRRVIGFPAMPINKCPLN